MIQQKYKLPNGSTFIWLGDQLIHGCENVLILSSGDILFLKTHRRENGAKIRSDMKTLTKENFISSYEWPNNSSSSDLYLEIGNQ